MPPVYEEKIRPYVNVNSHDLESNLHLAQFKLKDKNFDHIKVRQYAE